MTQTQRKSSTSTKSLVCCALLAALSIIMARVLSFAVPGGARYSLDKFPLFLAGMLFGPIMGGLTGFVADFLGSLMQFGFNPLFCPPAILYGIAGGLFRWYIQKKPTLFRIGLSYLFPVLLGSILYQSAALAYIYNDGVFTQALLYNLGTRSVQFGITLVLEVLIIHTLMKWNVFTRLGVWPPVEQQKQQISTQRIAMNAVMVALYFCLAMFVSITVGGVRITVRSLPVIFCAIAFGPVDAAIVGFLGEFLSQMLTYGFTVTTLLWVLPYVLQGLFVGICARILSKRLSVGALMQTGRSVLLIVICILSAEIVACFNTLAYYVDSKMFGYYNYALVFGDFWLRAVLGIATGGVSAIAIVPVVRALKKARILK